MNTLTVTADIHPENREEFMQTIRSVNESLKNEKGFKRSSLFQDVDNPNRFNLIQEWGTHDDLAIHLRSDIFRVLMGALKVLAQRSEIRYDLTSHQPGRMILDN